MRGVVLAWFMFENGIADKLIGVELDGCQPTCLSSRVTDRATTILASVMFDDFVYAPVRNFLVGYPAHI
jgi:hypothetical protein